MFDFDAINLFSKALFMCCYQSVACKFAFRQTCASDRRRCPHFGTSYSRMFIKI